MWLRTSSIQGLSSPETVTRLSIVEDYGSGSGGMSRSGGESESGSASSYYVYNRQGP
jgi:hypothetical protein